MLAASAWPTSSVSGREAGTKPFSLATHQDSEPGTLEDRCSIALSRAAGWGTPDRYDAFGHGGCALSTRCSSATLSARPQPGSPRQACPRDPRRGRTFARPSKRRGPGIRSSQTALNHDRSRSGPTFPRADPLIDRGLENFGVKISAEGGTETDGLHYVIRLQFAWAGHMVGV